MFPVLSANSASGYFLTKSLRFEKSTSTYLNRTPSTAGNRQKFTWSSWVKIGLLNSDGYLINAGFIVNGGATDQDGIVYTANGNIEVNIGYINGTVTGRVTTIASFRDPSAWYHIVVAIDTTQATAGNRCLIYVNGVSVPYTTVATIPQNFSTEINNTIVHNIGRLVPDGFGGAAWIHFDGYMAEMNFIDGQQLTPSSFGSTNPVTGVWQPAKYTGTYGTNGFYLPFTNTTSTSTLGNDFSGNGNNWTTNNFSLTAGASYDSMNDVPTLTSITQANYATLNPLAFQSAAPTAGNLDGNGTNNCTATIACPSTGKYYFEMTMTNAGASGQIGIFATTCPITSLTAGTMLYTTEGRLYENDVLILSSYATFTNGDTVAVAVDMSASQVSFYKNNTLQGTRSFVSQITSSSPIFAVRLNTGVTASVNFGQRPFAYTPPSGFKALNTYNLPDSTIVAGNKYMDATIYAGTGANATITNSGAFKPDLVWVKNRSISENHALYDSNRGVNQRLVSNSTGAESTVAGVSAFNSNGFDINVNYSTSGNNYVGWQWQAGQGTTSSNTSGTVTSTVSVNASAGFSIVTYTGTGVSNATVGHGLGVAPSLVILKARTTNSTSNNWWVNHSSFTSGNNAYLNTNDAEFAVSSTTSGGLGTMNSTIFTLANGASTNNNTNQTSCAYVAYCWTPIAGYSNFGSYSGNGSTNGPFVYTGFRPKYIMVKRTNNSVTGDWIISDTSRSPFNVADSNLFTNLTNGDSSGLMQVDLLSNGFKVRANTWGNQSGSPYIYIAFAENPFKNALAR